MEMAKKIKRTAVVMLVLVSVILLLDIFFFAAHPPVFGAMPVDAMLVDDTPDGVIPIGPVDATLYGSNTALAIFDVFSFVIGILLLLSMLALSLILLFSVKKDESPFCRKNVKLLKGIAIALIAFEPFGLLVQWVRPALIPPPPSGEFMVFSTAFTTQTGFVFTAGLIVYCIALVFEHGISLQKQVDETL